MASESHTAAWQQRAAVPRVVLPVTRGGLAVTDRLCWLALAAGMAVAAGLILYLNRGTTFYVDEIAWLYETPGLGAGEVLDPHNGHLIAVTRLVFKAILETVGTEYLAFRLLGVASLLLCVGLFYALVKRRIGALPALAPALALLFLGSASQHVLIPIGFTPLFSIAAGLAALLVLERDDRRGDIGACALLVLSILTYSTGLAFAVGVGLSVMLRPDRWRRAWVFALPFALYAGWWIVEDDPTDASQEPRPSNLLLIPRYAAESLAAVLAGLAGLGFDFGDPSQGDTWWGRVLAVAAVVALAIRIGRGRVSPSLWTSLAIVLTFWSLGAIVTDANRLPTDVRYIFMGSVGVLLVATDAARTIRFTRAGLIALLAVLAVSLSTNVALLRDRGAAFRAESAMLRAEYAMLDLSRDHLDQGFTLFRALPSHTFLAFREAGEYYAVQDRYGSAGFTVPELERQPEEVREHADQTLSRLLGLRVEPAPRALPSRGCEEIEASEGAAGLSAELPPGGAVLQVDGDDGADLSLARFAALPTASLGTIRSGQPIRVRIPRDGSARPWQAGIAPAAAVTVCPIR